MQNKTIHYTLAALSFLVAAGTYLTTMQPSIPFWDCGEFLGAAATLGISHPPGAPMWTLAGRILSMPMPFADPAAKMNALSALCGALAAMFLYLTTVRIIRVWRGNPQSTSDIIMHFGGAFIAALAFTWSDSVWFNSNEFIVFAPGLLFISIIIWLGMIWHENAEAPGSEKYLLLIFYLIGLSMGAHQMSMLAFFPVWVIVYYKHWPKMSVGKWLEMLVTGLIAFLFYIPGGPYWNSRVVRWCETRDLHMGRCNSLDCICRVLLEQQSSACQTRVDRCWACFPGI